MLNALNEDVVLPSRYFKEVAAIIDQAMANANAKDLDTRMTGLITPGQLNGNILIKNAFTDANWTPNQNQEYCNKVEDEIQDCMQRNGVQDDLEIVCDINDAGECNIILKIIVQITG